ncbi:unnamed protein product [Ranitomeya imitator]|uniref:Immunoglobulin V-set domain-containing protein n=1 Tax=Ranitomeya imitator TaxID=111125 RepID=A0ABN9L0U1_9NEOB|nr:unnamed protein product [Ranitomeya imitator]
MGLKDEKAAKSLEDIMFGGLEEKRKRTFPVNSRIKALIEKEWRKPEESGNLPSASKRRYPFEDKDSETWDKVPKIDGVVARSSKKLSLPLEDSGVLRDPLDKKADGFLRHTWEATAGGLKPAIAGTCVSRSLIVWLQQIEEQLKSKAPRDEILTNLTLAKEGLIFGGANLVEAAPREIEGIGTPETEGDLDTCLKVPQHRRKSPPNDARPEVGGRLSSFLPAWVDISPSHWTLKVIEHGLRIDFVFPPRQTFVLTPQRKTPEEQLALEAEELELVSKRVLVEVPGEEQGKECSYSSVSGRLPHNRELINTLPNTNRTSHINATAVGVENKSCQIKVDAGASAIFSGFSPGFQASALSFARKQADQNSKSCRVSNSSPRNDIEKGNVPVGFSDVLYTRSKMGTVPSKTITMGDPVSAEVVKRAFRGKATPFIRVSKKGFVNIPTTVVQQVLQVFYYHREPYPPERGRFLNRAVWDGNAERGDGSIIIMNIQQTDNGTYLCQVKNPPDAHGEMGEITFSEIMLLALIIGVGSVVIILIVIAVVSFRYYRKQRTHSTAVSVMEWSFEKL